MRKEEGRMTRQEKGGKDNKKSGGKEGRMKMCHKLKV